VDKRLIATTEERLFSLSPKAASGENMDEVHLADDDKPLD